MKKIIGVIIFFLGFFTMLAIYFDFRSEKKNELLNTSPIENISPTIDESHLDLSYIEVFTNPEVEVSLLDVNGKAVGQAYIQEPIKNPATGMAAGSAQKQIYLEKPNSGMYILKTNSPKEYTLAIYLYDRNGEVSIKKIKTTGEKVYRISNDKENSQNSLVSQ